jgi:hypothetical protein
MKLNKLTLFGAVAVFCFGLMFTSCSSGSDESETETEETEMETSADDENENLPSPRRQAHGMIASVHATVDYGSPAVRGREVWGALEPWGEVWRAGANATTSVTFDADVVINGQTVAAGKYGVFMIPNEGADWVVILNTAAEGWGAYDYNQENDVVRVSVSPEWTDEVAERLMYAVENGGIRFGWDKVRLFVPVQAAQ